jgi:hypothetical protein
MGFYDEQSFLVEIASIFELQHAGVKNHTGSGVVGIANRSISKCIGDLRMILPNSVEEALEGLPKGSCNIP